MKVFKALFIVILVLGIAESLSLEEEACISDFLSSWPNLGKLVPPWTSNASSACDSPPFIGITCTEGPEKHVIGLEISGEAQQGTVPVSISKLAWLETFKLNARLLGGIPSSIGNLTRLKVLELVVPFMQQILPEELGSLTNLVSLQLEFATYLYPVGDWIGNFHLLQSIILHGSPTAFAIAPFAGPLPSSFCNLNLLEYISFRSVGLKDFSQCRGRLNQLRHLSIWDSPSLIINVSDLTLQRPRLNYLKGDHVSGELHLEGLENLEWLLLATDISGTLPASLWANTQLIELDLSKSRITGTFPNEIGNLKRLRNLLLPSTRISGTIPPQIGKLRELERLELNSCNMDGLIPTEIGELTNLRVLMISSNRFSGTLPASLGRLSKLTTIDFGSCMLVGSIPEDLMAIETLTSIRGSNNRLTGSIPDIQAGRASDIQLQLQNNRLTGTIPVEILRIASEINLEGNLLSGTIPASISDNKWPSNINLADNLLEGPLVPVSPNRPIILVLSNNKLSGTIPTAYRDSDFYSIEIANNQLEGVATHLLQNKRIQARLDLSNNKFSGTIPDLSSLQASQILISGNSFTGEIPSLPSSIDIFLASHNQLSGNIDHIFEASWNGSSKLRILDLSNNQFEGSLSPKLMVSNISFLSLASNSFVGTITSPKSKPVFLNALDLSNNKLTGPLPAGLFPRTSRLKVAGNQLSGSLQFEYWQVLEELDISNNEFSFEVSLFARSPYLSFIAATNNKLFGKLSLQGMPSLQRCDLSQNELDIVPDFISISHLFTNYSLNFLSIKDNARIPPIDNLYELISETSLRNTKLESPSNNLTGVVCNVLNFDTNGNNVFNYDEWLFSYQQCMCDRDHYGKPPIDCYSCQSLDESHTTACGTNTIVKKAHYYIYLSSTPSTAPFKVEPCLSEEMSVLDSTNCLELTIKFLDDFTLISSASRGSEQAARVIPTQSELALQCQLGSSGRLCSRCDCHNYWRDGSCYYPRAGNLCAKCSRVFSPSQFVPLSLAILSVACAILSTIFYFLLASKRSLKDTKWEELSIGKRIVYRLIHLTTLGQITITVNFVQILVEVTRWDKYALQSWIKLANGESEGLGLVCFLPFLSNATWMLVLRLLLPFIVTGFLCGCIVIAEFLHRFVAFIRIKSIKDHETDIEDDSESISSDPLISTTTKSKGGAVSYPAKALAISTSISVVRFLYFGTTMAAHEYLFKEAQIGSGEVYVQSKPWMKYSKAQNLRSISIPFVLVFLFVFPSAFIILSWKLRHKIGSPFVRLYFGSLFENFRHRVFWWEIVNILKKVLIALVLRGIPKTDSFLPLVVAFFLALFGTLTFVTRPWKVEYENYLEGIGSLLTIISLLANWTRYLAHSTGAMLCIFILDVIFVFVGIAVIVWKTIQTETQYEIEWEARFGSKLDEGGSAHSHGPPLLLLDMEENFST